MRPTGPSPIGPGPASTPAVYIGNVDPTAARIYDEIRRKPADVARIARNTGIPDDKLDQIKTHLFHRQYDLAIGPGETRRANFTPDSDIADLWLKAEAATLDTVGARNFHRLMAHEYVESSLMSDGMPYRAADPGNWDSDLVNWPSPQHYGAHDVAPLVDSRREPFAHWESLLGRKRPGVSEIERDLSNLDAIILQIRRERSPL